MNNYKKTLAYIALVSLFGVTGFVFGALNTTSLQAKKHAQLANAATALEPTTPNFDGVSLTAKAAYVFDIANNEILYQKNANAQLPLASITKVALALLAHEHLKPDGLITLSESALAIEGESGFTVGETWRVQELIDFTLMTSSNDGAQALAEAIERATNKSITELLNKKAAKLGMSQTYFVNATGLDSSTHSSGSYGSAQDLGTLFTHAYNTSTDLFAATVFVEKTFSSTRGITYEGENTNKVIGELSGLVFGKTGFTDLAGGNLGVVIESEPGHSFAVIVLGSTVEKRFDDAVALVQVILDTQTQ